MRILLGVESFVESDLRLYNKTYQVSDIIDTIQLCRQNLIYPICSFIFLNPYTKLSDFEYNLGECNRLHLLDFLPASLNVLRPEKDHRTSRNREGRDRRTGYARARMQRLCKLPLPQ